jgi:hypothetical protein
MAKKLISFGDAKTVPCPVHPDHELPIQEEETDQGTRLFAVCECDVSGNAWRGKEVWSQMQPRAGEKSIGE